VPPHVAEVAVAVGAELGRGVERIQDQVVAPIDLFLTAQHVVARDVLAVTPVVLRVHSDHPEGIDHQAAIGRLFRVLFGNAVISAVAQFIVRDTLHGGGDVDIGTAAFPLVAALRRRGAVRDHLHFLRQAARQRGLVRLAEVLVKGTVLRQACNTRVHRNLRAGALHRYVQEGVAHLHANAVVHPLVEPDTAVAAVAVALHRDVGDDLVGAVRQ
jgi:hypothetical protein